LPRRLGHPAGVVREQYTRILPTALLGHIQQGGIPAEQSRGEGVPELLGLAIADGRPRQDLAPEAMEPPLVKRPTEEVAVGRQARDAKGTEPTQQRPALWRGPGPPVVHILAERVQERDESGSAGLGRSHEALRSGALDVDEAFLKIEIAAPQRAHLTGPHPGLSPQPEERYQKAREDSIRLRPAQDG
jgi:hypothetical protein